MKVWLKKFRLEIEEIKDKEIETLTEREWGNWNAQPFESSSSCLKKKRKQRLRQTLPPLIKNYLLFYRMRSQHNTIISWGSFENAFLTRKTMPVRVPFQSILILFSAHSRPEMALSLLHKQRLSFYSAQLLRRFRSDAALEALANASKDEVPNLVLYNYPSFSGAFSALFAYLYHSHINQPCIILPFSSVAPFRWKCYSRFFNLYWILILQWNGLWQLILFLCFVVLGSCMVY